MTVDARFAMLVPSNISETDATIFPTNAFTSATALFSNQGPFASLDIHLSGRPESKIFDYAAVKMVIVGGTTACGKFAVQFARITGIGSIIVTASLSSAKELESYGATHILDRKAPDVEAQIRALGGN